MNPMFWQGKRVLVTGHTGFKALGSAFAQFIRRTGRPGYALDPPTQPSLYDSRESIS